jgi:predicted transcriptional regulator
MEVHFSPEKESLIQELAARVGKDSAEVVQEAVDRMLEYETGFLEAVEQGRAAARRGELLDHSEVVRRIERKLRA